jgi:hypothetical protein
MSRSRGSKSGSSVRARKTSSMLTSWPGRYSISTWSPARISPEEITRKYAPGRAAWVKRLIQPACASQP